MGAGLTRLAPATRGVTYPMKILIVAIIMLFDGTRIEVGVPSRALCESLTRAIAESVASANCYTRT